MKVLFRSAIVVVSMVLVVWSNWSPDFGLVTVNVYV